MRAHGISCARRYPGRVSRLERPDTVLGVARMRAACLRRKQLPSLRTGLAALLVVAVCGVVSDAAAAPASYHPDYQIAALLSSAEHRVEGTVTVRFVNTSDTTLSDA